MPNVSERPAGATDPTSHVDLADSLREQSIIGPALPLAERAGRRAVRCVALTSTEEEHLRARAGALAKEALVGLTATKRGIR